MQVWFDVEDFFVYAAHTARPSGIQRLAFELQRAMLDIAPGTTHFVRHGKSETGFVTVPFAEVETLFASLAQPTVYPDAEDHRPAHADDPAPRPGRLRRGVSRTMARLPPDIASSLRRFRTHQTRAFCALFQVARSSVATVRSRPKRNGRNLTGRDGYRALETIAAPGDWLVVAGSSWALENYAERIGAVRSRIGMRFALLMCDVIPVRRPEWCDRNVTRAFKAWHRDVLPLADRVLAISRNTARDVERYAAEADIRLRGPVHPVPVGAGFGRMPAETRTRRLPPPGSFVLVVSTIEARKNHALLVRVWRELLETMPKDKVPTLIFAGRIGWMVADLLQQLENADWLGGRIRLIDSPDDGELAALYRDCLFTVFPSLYEGWGLPVTESLAFGTPCLAANTTSLPEAGGTFARYFDPDDLHDAVRAVRAVLDDPAGLQAWREDIRRNFRPVPWTDSAASLLRLLERESRP
ncbi:MAG TPA: glycosyltransferase family 1 protein [Acidiphilium sp.]